MRRRQFVAAAGTAIAPLAGCAGDDASGATSTETESAASQTASEEALLEALDRADVEVLDLRYDDGRVVLEYEPADPTERGVEESVEAIARAYFDRVYGGWTAERLDASAFVDGELVATWRMDSRWIDEYLDGEITRAELGERVEDSVERHDEEGDGEGTEATNESG